LWIESIDTLSLLLVNTCIRAVKSVAIDGIITTNWNLNPLLLQAPDTYYKLPPEAWKPPDYKEFMQVNVLSAVIGAHTSSPVLPMLIREKTRANQG